MAGKYYVYATANGACVAFANTFLFLFLWRQAGWVGPWRAGRVTAAYTPGLSLNSGGQRMDSDGVKLYCATMAKNVSDRAIQVLGGYVPAYAYAFPIWAPMCFS